MTDNFKSVLENILKKDKRLVDDSGELNGNLIHEYASSLDEGLIDLLLNEEATREKFFLKVKDVYVFKQNDFKFFLDENKIDNSYTQYANRIGLSTGGKFLKDIDDVVLDFPYKDCVLEGGQSTEEGTDTYFEYDENEQDYIEKEAKRKEIFFNQILAKDEIDRLTEPKAFTNIKRYTEKGEEKITSFNRDEKNQITDNLLIKGNNLLGLHSLKDKFKERVKLIYIDPPYYFKEKQGDDAFAYNSNFKLSTWLTFMKNRLEIAFELLTLDGLIYVQTNEDGQAHLKILMDSLFSEKRFVSQITWQRTSEGRSALGQGSSFIINSTEYLLCYTKQKKPTRNFIKKRVEATEKALNQYSAIFKSEGARELEKTIKDSKGNPIKIFKHINYEYKGIPSSTSNKERLKVFDFLVREAAQQKESSLQQKILSEIDPNSLYSVEYTPTAGKNKGKSRKAYYINGGILLFLRDYAETDGEFVYRLATMNDFWSHDEIQVTGIAGEGGVNLKRGKKPEKLIQRIIEMSTKPGDIVLDYHLGSGTTVAVAHKLKRKFIGVEQLDYGDEDSYKRLQNVIKGDKSGISSEIDWKGGGSFVYCELAKNNQKAIDKVMSCKSLKELITLFDELYKKYFLNYNVKVKEFKEKIIKEKEFQNLSIDRQKEIFARMLDLNQLYVNVSDMEDSQFKLSDEDIALTKNFYQL